MAGCGGECFPSPMKGSAEILGRFGVDAGSLQALGESVVLLLCLLWHGGLLLLVVPVQAQQCRHRSRLWEKPTWLGHAGAMSHLPSPRPSAEILAGQPFKDSAGPSKVPTTAHGRQGQPVFLPSAHSPGPWEPPATPN